MGAQPDWDELLDAADRLRCTPWELSKQPRFWIEAVFARDAAYAHARNPTGGES